MKGPSGRVGKSSLQRHMKNSFLLRNQLHIVNDRVVSAFSRKVFNRIFNNLINKMEPDYIENEVNNVAKHISTR